MWNIWNMFFVWVKDCLRMPSRHEDSWHLKPKKISSNLEQRQVKWLECFTIKVLEVQDIFVGSGNISLTYKRINQCPWIRYWFVLHHLVYGSWTQNEIWTHGQSMEILMMAHKTTNNLIARSYDHELSGSYTTFKCTTCKLRCVENSFNCTFPSNTFNLLVTICSYVFHT